ncbi:pantoate kinase [Methanothermobacter wolfeii]|uniref:Pantoate kinase n=1 Tax=Methanothermobacter wolfeii TaxID=145261 RepID=A0A9E7UMJ3_METWO|nr:MULTISPECIES: pantoate kinase [Methanothermobacter]QHN06394.1 kinase [Methanothermobacter sp. THM-1]UXH30876.1 pantoate kinase [Methanothermobacter wolfeii]SCM57192.1 Pantoate kinase [Methanothermobacter wolfeii]
MKAAVFVPSHITGFFEIIRKDDPLRTGSRGAGVVLDRGVMTRVRALRSEDKTRVVINGRTVKDDPVTRRAVELLREHTGFRGGIKVCHKIQVPVGCGFGTSAACALGTILAAVRELELPVTVNTAGAIAHRVEVELGTGLGDLIAELTGGIVIRTREGPPGYGVTDRIVDQGLHVISLTLGELDTSSIITDAGHVERINRTASGMMKKLLKEPSPELFMRLSREFAERTGLINPELREMADSMAEDTVGASMAMLGNTVFALSENPDTEIEGATVSGIDFSGARFID